MASAAPNKAAKRRRGGDDDLDGNVAIESIADATPKNPALRSLEGIGMFPTRSTEELAAAVWAAYRATGNTRVMTDLELGPSLGAEHIAAPLSLEEDLGRFIQAVLPHWRRELAGGGVKAAAGAPVVLVVAPSAIRSAALLKPLAVFHARIFKCFAKHLSLDDHRAVLAGPPVQLAIGTPHRLRQLLELGILSLARCRLVVLDLAPDAKRYTLLTNPSLADDAALLLRAHVLPLVTGGAAAAAGEASAKVAVFPGFPVAAEQQLLRQRARAGAAPQPPKGAAAR